MLNNQDAKQANFAREMEDRGLPTIRANWFAGQEPQPREWIDGQQLFFKEEVNYLSGDGAVGKSLLMLQLAAAVACLEKPCPDTFWLGQKVRLRGEVVFFSTEDGRKEIHRRLVDICAGDGFDMRWLVRLQLIDMTNRTERALFATNGKGKLAPTPTLVKLNQTLSKTCPDLVILDNRAQIFIGEERDRNIATGGNNQLQALCLQHRTTMIVLAHPSLTGIANKTGASGSTGWHNGGRNAVFMHMPEDPQPMDPRRVLTSSKANYGPRGNTVNMKWDMGRFVGTDEPPRADAGLGKGDKAERVFMSLMRLYRDRNMELSANGASSSKYAPKVFFEKETAKREGMSKRDLEKAMLDLIDRGELKNRDDGKGTRQRSVLEIAEKGSENG